MAITIRHNPNVNGLFEITIANSSTEGVVDRVEPLRLPEVIIVLSVLLLWCCSIFIFIRHSQLLRIRHRDLPFRSTMKAPTNSNHITFLHRTSDMAIHSKSQLPSHDGLTPPLTPRMINECETDQRYETTSLTVSPITKKRRHTHSFDLKRTLSSAAQSFDKQEDRQQLLHPHRISADIKRSLLDLHRKSADNIQRKSMINLASIRFPTFFSTNDISRGQCGSGQRLLVQKRRLNESPL